MTETSEVSYPACGAKKRQGEGFCTRPAGWGTDHAGVGRCKFHGGATPRKTGLRSKLRGQLPTIRARYEAYLKDPKLMNLQDVAAWARALCDDWIERYEPRTLAFIKLWPELRAALKRMLNPGSAEEAEEAIKKIRELIRDEEDGIVRVPDVIDAYKIVNTITQTVERWDKIENRNAVTIEDFRRFQFNVMNVVGNETRAICQTTEEHQKLCARIQEKMGNLPV